MAEKIGDAVLELRTDTKKLVKGMDAAKQNADKSMKQMQARADKFAKFMKGALGIGGVVIAFNMLKRVVGDMVTAYGVQEIAETKLKAAIKATGKELSVSADSLFDYASELQGVTTFGDEATISAMAMLQQLGDLNEEGLKKTIPLVQDFAAAMGVDLETAASLVGKTLGSSTNALSRYGLEVDMTGTKEEKLTSLTDAMREKFGGMAKELAQTGTGSLQQYQNALGDLKEMGGEVVLDFLQPTVSWLTEIAIATAKAIKETRDYKKLIEDGADSEKTITEQIELHQKQLDKLLILQTRMGTDVAYRESIKAAKDMIKSLQDVLAAEQLAAQARALGDHAAVAAAAIEVDAAVQKAKDAEDLIAWLKIINDKYALTDKSRAEALEAEIAYFENMSEEAVKTMPMFEAVLDMLYKQRVAHEDLTIALEDHMSATEALSISAAESYLIEKEAAEELLQQKKDQVAFITGPFVDAYGDAFEAFGAALIEGGNAWDAFREAFKEAIAGLLDAISQKLIIMALEALIPLPGIFNPAGAALAFAGAAAARGAGGAVRALTTGGDFETRGPQMIMVGDNPGGRERVSVTPVSSPNVNGPGQMIHVTVNFAGRTFYDEISRASENGDIIIHPRSIKR